MSTATENAHTEHVCSTGARPHRRVRPLGAEAAARHRVSDRQRDVLRVLVDRVGVPPTQRELAAALGMSLRRVQEHLVKLEEKGWILCVPDVSRGIVLSPLFVEMHAVSTSLGLELVGLQAVR
jgi:SOS-response transcriptional repressor LexA